VMSEEMKMKWKNKNFIKDVKYRSFSFGEEMEDEAEITWTVI
jgi:hypothetical protein